jgi:hypothetical protein
MKIYLSCTANLGDFLNAMPVLSGIHNSYGKFEFIIRNEMKKFNGIKHFLSHQQLFTDVFYDDEVILYGEQPLYLSSWTREDRNSDIRPVETCRYENWIRDNYNLNFEVDDNFTLKLPEVEIEFNNDRYILGDRWDETLDPSVDSRRKTRVLEDSGKFDNNEVHYLDYNQDLCYNVNIIKFSEKPFITTFTGIGILSDLLGKETYVLWDDDMEFWDGRPVQYDFERHYYADRKSKLRYIKDFNLGELND